MCRIVGLRDFRFNDQYDLSSVIESMRDTMQHGGPDDSGIYINQQNAVAVGHRRLSILDLSMLGHQPMQFENLSICYNGEVYNFKTIRNNLLRKGYTFDSDSDTEVILKAFHCWGKNAVSQFRGMWAFSIWDEKEKTLTLCRDRMGVKPLYWYYNDGLFLYASELKAFHKHPKFVKSVDIQGLSLFFQYNNITAPHTIFENTYKLLPGHFLTLSKQGDITVEPYWRAIDYVLANKPNQYLTNETEAIEELEAILTDSFMLRLVADVPVGVFLSGGIDSSLVTALIQKNISRPLRTFTIGFHENGFDEAKQAKKIATHLGTDHTEFYCSSSDAYSVIKKLPFMYDEPFGDSSAIPTYLVSQMAREHVTVALSADGGDELFGGYPRYVTVANRMVRLQKILRMRSILRYGSNSVCKLATSINNHYDIISPNWHRISSLADAMNRVFESGHLLHIYDLSNRYFSQSELVSLGCQKVIGRMNKFNLQEMRSLPVFTQMMLIDLGTCLADDVLVKVDRATMNVALEGREPFLDNKLVEYALNMPIAHKCGKSTKYLLRRVLSKYLPEDVANAPKKGFEIPIHEWFKKELKDLYLEYLAPSRIKRHGLLNERTVEKYLDAYFAGKPVNPHMVWMIFIFQQWAEEWL